MKILQLFKDGNEIIATDGIMHVDGRFNIENIKFAVRERNKRFIKNFPHKIADSFAVYTNKIGGQISKQYSL